MERATHRELCKCTGDTLPVFSRELIVLVRIIGNNPWDANCAKSNGVPTHKYVNYSLFPWQHYGHEDNIALLVGNSKPGLKIGLISAKKPEQQAFKKYNCF